MRKSFLGLIAIGFTALAAHGDIIPILAPSTPAPTAGGFTWNYAGFVTADESVHTGDWFTIYDFGTFNPGSNTQPAGWAFSSSLTGVTPGLVLPTDSPTTLNLTWTYTGTTPLDGGAFLGSFAVVTTTDQLRQADFAAQATLNSGPNAGSKVDNVGQVSVPVPEMSALFPILSVCGAGVVASIPSLLRRRKKS